MKTFSYILTALTAAMLATGCVDEAPNYSKDKPEPVDPATTGFLAVGALDLRVIRDTELMPDETRAGSSATTEALPGDFTVELLDSEGATVRKMSYAEWQQEMASSADNTLELPVGTYTLKAYSTDRIAPAAWDQPEYAGSKQFTIQKQKTTTIDDLVCTLANIKVTLAYSADLADLLSDDTQAEISVGGHALTFTKTETRAGFYIAEEALNTLNFSLAGSYADDGKPVSLKKTISGVKPGQWRRIQLIIEHASDGDVKFTIRIDSFELDGEVIVNGTETLEEELINEETTEDPDAPKIVWEGHDLGEPFRLTSDLFDEQGQCTVPFRFNVTSKNGIRSFVIRLASTNEAFISSLSTMGLPAEFDLCTLEQGTTLYTMLKGFGYPLGDEIVGRNELAFDISGQMSLLYEFSGTHTFTFTMTDNKGLESTRDLTLIVEKGPEVEWVGYDIDRAYTLTDDMQIEVRISAPAGVKSFMVTIDAPALYPLLDEVQVPSLKNPFDLCTVTGAEEEFLSGTVGFPTGSKVLNQTALSFNITDFVPALLAVEDEKGAEIPYDFKLEITDNNGDKTVKTLQLRKAAIR